MAVIHLNLILLAKKATQEHKHGLIAIVLHGSELQPSGKSWNIGEKILLESQGI